MKKTLLVYVIAYLVLLTVVLGLLYTYPKAELHMMLNAYHTRLEDTFFKYFTILAEWPLYALALLPLLWKKIKITLFFAISELTGGAVLQALKFFFKSDRPASVFENYPDMTLPLVEGVNMHHGNSFPSGHASTFFVFCTCCALILAYRHQKRARQLRAAANPEVGESHKANLVSKRFLLSLTMLSLLIFAVLGAYSRIYLSQHFLSDVCVGSIIGFTTPLLIFYFGRDKILKPKSE